MSQHEAIDNTDFGVSVQPSPGSHTLKCLSATLARGETDGKAWARLRLRVRSKTEPNADTFADSMFVPTVEDVAVAEAARQGESTPGFEPEQIEMRLDRVKAFGKMLKRWGVVAVADAAALEAFASDSESKLEKFKGAEADARVYFVDQRDFTTKEPRLGADGEVLKETKIGY